MGRRGGGRGEEGEGRRKRKKTSFEGKQERHVGKGSWVSIISLRVLFFHLFCFYGFSWCNVFMFPVPGYLFSYLLFCPQRNGCITIIIITFFGNFSWCNVFVFPVTVYPFIYSLFLSRAKRFYYLTSFSVTKFANMS